MRKLKNWTITAKPIKHGQNGLFNYYNYLNDNERHKNQTIKRLNTANSLANMLKINSDFEIERRTENKRHKGGRPSNIGWSAVLSYPFEVSDEQFRKIRTKVLYDFYNYINEEQKLNMTKEQILELIDMAITVIHRGDNVNNHIHIIMSKIMYKNTKKIIGKNETKFISIDLTKKKYLYKLKLINDMAIDEIMDINKTDYIIKNETQKPQKRRKSKIEIKLEQLRKKEEKLNVREEELKEAEKQLEEERKHNERLMYQQTQIIAEYRQKLDELEQKSMSISDEIKHIRIYTKQQLDKDIERHTKYMEKGMTEKAKKLRTKIESKIKKSTTTLSK